MISVVCCVNNKFATCRDVALSEFLLLDISISSLHSFGVNCLQKKNALTTRVTHFVAVNFMRLQNMKF